MEFELHLAAEAGTIPNKLRDVVYRLGFRDDGLVGRGVVFSPTMGETIGSCPLTGLHVTWDTTHRKDYRGQLSKLTTTLATFGRDCVAYAHGEVIRPEWDVRIAHRKFDAHVPFSLGRLQPRRRKEAKKWDIHLTARLERLSPALHDRLHNELQLYYIDIKKERGGIFRVYTIQGVNAVAEGFCLFQALRDYVLSAGGIDGAIKYERTIFWAEHGNCRIVPPVIDSLPVAFGA